MPDAGRPDDRLSGGEPDVIPWHCEKRSDEAIPSPGKPTCSPGGRLLRRFASRNDRGLVGARTRGRYPVAYANLFSAWSDSPQLEPQRAQRRPHPVAPAQRPGVLDAIDRLLRPVLLAHALLALKSAHRGVVARDLV